MTTIVYRNGFLAADTRAYSGDKPPIGQKTKIFRNDAKQLACGTSSSVVGIGEHFWKWLNGQISDERFNAIFDNNEEKRFTALVIEKGRVFLYDDSIFPTGPLTADYFAIGSGEEYALGALEMGASAEQAVRVACKHDIWSQEPIMVMDLRTSADRKLDEQIEGVLKKPRKAG